MIPSPHSHRRYFVCIGESRHLIEGWTRDDGEPVVRWVGGRLVRACDLGPVHSEIEVEVDGLRLPREPLPSSGHGDEFLRMLELWIPPAPGTGLEGSPRDDIDTYLVIGHCDRWLPVVWYDEAGDPYVVWDAGRLVRAAELGKVKLIGAYGRSGAWRDETESESARQCHASRGGQWGFCQHGQPGDLTGAVYAPLRLAESLERTKLTVARWSTGRLVTRGVGKN